MRRVAVLVAVAAAVLAASCSSAISTPLRVLPCTPSDERLDKQMVLMAQSVPTASAVPCLRAELDDWFLDDLDSWDGDTNIEFSRLIDQVALEIDLTRNCDRGAAVETATDQPGTRRFDERIRDGSTYRDRRFYLLPRGVCGLQLPADRHGSGGGGRRHLPRDRLGQPRPARRPGAQVQRRPAPARPGAVLDARLNATAPQDRTIHPSLLAR